MKIGYARTSTLDQEAGLQDQIERLKSVGCEKVFTEKVSSVDTRPKLEMAIEFVRTATLSLSPNWIVSRDRW